MKIKLIITSVLILLTTLLWSSVDYVETGELTNKTTVCSDTTNTVDYSCHFVYYPKTAYTSKYYVNDLYSGGAVYRANWFYNTGYSACKLKPNNYSCMFDTYSGYGYYYFVWVRVR